MKMMKALEKLDPNGTQVPARATIPPNFRAKVLFVTFRLVNTTKNTRLLNSGPNGKGENA